MHMPTKDMLEAALDYASRGYPVLRLHGFLCNRRCACGDTRCANPGAHPLTPLPEASTDVATIQAWDWRNCNIAIRCGTGLAILVVEGAHGEKALTRLTKISGALPKTPVVTWPGGKQYLFVAPLGTPTRVLAQGLVLRGEGDYAVMPPSFAGGGP